MSCRENKIMSATLTLKRSTTQAMSHQEVYDWLYLQAEKLGLRISLSPEDERMESGMLSLPVHVEDATDAYDNILKLKKLENTWNDREPKPSPPLYLTSAKNPVQRAAWDRIDKATLRKMKAADALADATTEAEERHALAELRAARAEEVQAEAENAALDTRKAA